MVNKFGFIFLPILIAIGLLSGESRELKQPSASADLHQNSTSAPLSAVTFTDFILAMQWPPTFCAAQSCAQIPQRFTIHGLWPQNTGDPGPNYLTDAILNAYKTELLQYWPDLKYKDFDPSKAFWYDQYYKHGVYCTNKYSAEEYIANALAFGITLKPHEWLAAKNIKPDWNNAYKVSDIVAAIKSSTGFTPDLQCLVDSNNDYYLVEVRICLDAKLENLINCQGKRGQCAYSDYAYYLPAPALKEASENISEKIEKLGIYEVI